MHDEKSKAISTMISCIARMIDGSITVSEYQDDHSVKVPASVLHKIDKQNQRLRSLAAQMKRQIDVIRTQSPPPAPARGEVGEAVNGCQQVFDTVTNNLNDLSKQIVHVRADYLQTLIRAASQAQPVAREAEGLGAEMNNDLLEILGRPNFACRPFANALRQSGIQIEQKAEHEQAYAINWMLGFYIKHGNEWRKHAGEALESLLKSGAVGE